MHREDEIIASQELKVGDRRFVWEEFWEEDDSGYCVSDYILAKHTRLSVYEEDGTLVKQFDFDGKEYEKGMVPEGNDVIVTWHPSFDEKRSVRISGTDLGETEL